MGIGGDPPTGGGLRSVLGRSDGKDRLSIDGEGTWGGFFWGRSARGGRRDEELEEADREMSAAAGSRECDSAGPAGGGKLGLGAGPGAAVGPALGWAGSAVWPVDARGEDQSPGGPPEAGTLGQKFCDVLLRRA